MIKKVFQHQNSAQTFNSECYKIKLRSINKCTYYIFYFPQGKISISFLSKSMYSKIFPSISQQYRAKITQCRVV